jgi:hypothetical protein
VSEAAAKVFGIWDAPITDGAEQIDVPTDLACIHCRETFHEGDNGAIMPTGFAEHRECGLRAVWGGIGHHVDHERYCRGRLGCDAGLSRRQSALLVWACSHGKTVAEETLSALRDGNAIMCSRCGRVSYDPEDVRHGYCHDCRKLTGVPSHSSRT